MSVLILLLRFGVDPSSGFVGADVLFFFLSCFILLFFFCGVGGEKGDVWLFFSMWEGFLREEGREGGWWWRGVGRRLFEEGGFGEGRGRCGFLLGWGFWRRVDGGKGGGGEGGIRNFCLAES